ncbi:class I SAM-dependent methyltransferase [Legionella lansingensis]|nr:class I SAM-dependent methyltransferase [Legionella lansingensis]
MKSDFFYKIIQTACTTYIKTESHPEFPIIQKLLKELEEIACDEFVEPIYKMTKMTIFFEGFYQALQDDSQIKKELLQIRLQRWEKHYGVPTLGFLLSYKSQIEEISHQFKMLTDSGLSDLNKQTNKQTNPYTTHDDENNVIIDSCVTAKVPLPTQKEETGQFLKTYNPFGGFTTAPCDPYSQKFIEYAETVAKSGGKVLEIGAAFGAASLRALAQGVDVFCNDIEPQNLAVVHQRFAKENPDTEEFASGDYKKLVFIPGSFPHELQGLPKEHFDAILLCRVLHFSSGDTIESSLKLLRTLLKPNGKLFIVCETPYLKNWKNFIPEYEKKVAEGIEWPGEIQNPSQYESSGRATSLPKFVHWITKEVLDRSLQRTNFFIERSSYIDRKDQFPDDLLLDARESVGAVAIKI